jgi:all-trans-retinol 13,14-reductase
MKVGKGAIPVNDDKAKSGSRMRKMELFWIFMISLAIAITLSDVAVKWVLYSIGTGLFLLLAFIVSLTNWPKARPLRQTERASTFEPNHVTKNIDTIVIGSGSGGSTCANLLAQSGQRVLVLEQHPTATGGCTHSFREEKCEWDTGLHYTSKAMSQKNTRPGAIMDFMSRGTQEWTPLDDPYDEVLFPRDGHVKGGLPNHSTYPFVTGADPTVDQIMARIDPDNHELRERVRTYFNVCQEINLGFTALGISRILPSWLRFLVKDKIDKLMKYATFSVREVQHAVLNHGFTAQEILSAESLPKVPEGADPDPCIRRLKGILCHPIGDYAVQPREATMAAHGVTMAHYMGGAAYTVGATQKISIRLNSMVRNFGGEVFVDATVQEIIIENGRAVGVRVCKTSDWQGEHNGNEVPTTEIRAKNVVCATSIYNLYNKLLPQDLPVVKRFQDPTQRSVQQSHGHVFLFCKIKGDATELQLPTHNLWYFNNYDLDTAFDEYFTDPTSVRPPTVYIGFPCTKDKTWKRRFPGISNCVLISDGLYEWFEEWADKPVKNRGSDYMCFKEKLTKHLLDILYESVPQVQGKVEFHHLGTPLTEVTYLASFRGGSYGTKCEPTMFAPINREWTTTPHTTIPGLFLAGSDAFLPSVVGAMYGGGLGACAVLGHLGTMRLAWAVLGNLAMRIRENEPKMSLMTSYQLAFDAFFRE